MNPRKLIAFFMETEGNLASQTLRGGFWIFFSYALEKLLQFVRIAVLARILAPSDFGLLGMCLVVLGGIEIFTQTGIETALIQKKSENIDHYLNTAWTVALVRGFLLFAIIYFAAPAVADFFADPRLTLLLRVIGTVFVLSGISNIATVYFQKEMLFLKDTLLNQIPNIVSLVVAIGLALYLKDVWALVFAQIAGRLVSVWLSYSIHPFRPRIEVNVGILKDLFNFGKYILASGIIVYIITQGDNAMVGKLLGATALGFYALAYNLANIPTTAVSHLTSKLLLPVYSRFQSDIQKSEAIFAAAIRIIAYASFPLCLGMFILAEEVITIVYGTRWLPMVPAFRILCIYCLLRSVISHAGTLFVGVGHPRIGFYISVVNLVLMGIIIYPLTTVYGYTGTAVAVTAPFIVLFIIAYHRVGLLFGASPWSYFSTMFPPLLYALIMAAAVFATRSFLPAAESFINAAILAFMGAVIFTGLVFAFQREDLRRLRSVISDGMKA